MNIRDAKYKELEKLLGGTPTRLVAGHPLKVNDVLLRDDGELVQLNEGDLLVGHICHPEVTGWRRKD